MSATVKGKQARVPQGLTNSLKAIRGEGIPYKQLFDAITKSIQIEVGVVITSVPRGGLQVAQPQRLSEGFTKNYAREFHAEDRATWQSIIKRQAVNGNNVFPNFETSRYRMEFMKMNGLGWMAAAPLTSPVLGGYPGAIHIYRAEERGPFTSSDVQALGGIASELDKAIEKHRQARTEEACSHNYTMSTRPAVRQFIFDKDLKQRLPDSDLSLLDERLQQQMMQHARHRLDNLHGDTEIQDRLALPDSRGDLWVFRVVTRKTYPALGDGPFVFFCIPPSSCEWATVRPADFQADSELSRLIPALKFMEQEYRRGPSLGEIAKMAHLSPFHFHRRFTELLGLTPKHFMLDVQIDDAKRMLVEAEKELADIASICGFAHQSHFTSRFKQATGLTPTKWRRLAIERKRMAEFMASRNK